MKPISYYMQTLLSQFAKLVILVVVSFASYGYATPSCSSITSYSSSTYDSSTIIYINAPSDINAAYFPTWTDASGQDDLVWHQGTYNSDANRWECRINKSEHNNEYGSYIVHVYGDSASGESRFLGGIQVTFLTPKADSIWTPNTTCNEYQYTIYATNVRGASRVVFPTWTISNGQDDIAWYEGTYNANTNTWECRVQKSEHNFESGTIVTHAYAIDADSKYFFLGDCVVQLTTPNPDTYSLTCSYNERNQITSIKLSDYTTLACFTYNPDGSRDTTKLQNGATTKLGYDSENRVNSVTNTNRYNSEYYRENYGYDNRDRRTYTQYNTTRGDVYNYYSNNELASCKYDAEAPTTSPANWTRYVTYQLDNVGNRTTVSDNQTQSQYTPNAANQYSNISNCVITNTDGRGNVTYLRDTQYTYDAENRLIETTRAGITTTYKYDPDGKLLLKSVSGSTEGYFYLNNQQVLKVDGSNIATETNVWGPGRDELLVRRQKDTGQYYCNNNIQCNITSLSNESGDIIEKYKYDIYGQPYFYDANGSALANTKYSQRFLYTGQEYLGAINQYNYKSRIYSPEIGRFLQPDSIGFKSGDYNLYRYCNNNPINLRDPDGTIAIADDVIIGAALGAAVLVSYANSPAGKQAISTTVNYASDKLTTLGTELKNVFNNSATTPSETKVKSSEGKADDNTPTAAAKPMSPQAKGKQGEAWSDQEAIDAGETIIGKQVPVTTKDGKTSITDSITTTKDGKLKIREAKNGPNAKLTNGQKAVQKAVKNGETLTVGGSKATENAGLKTGQQIEVKSYEVDHYNYRD